MIRNENMHIKIIVLGKLKESYWQAACDEYLKRLTPYAKIEIIELKEEPFREKDTRAETQKKEAERVLPYIAEGKKKGVVIGLHEGGKEHTSVQLAKFLEEKTGGGAHVMFVIGGPLGFHPNILKQFDTQLSLSSLTFPHQLARVILIEQLYRAVTIINGKQYHY